MVGVSAPYTGATNAIRGVNGGGAPWVIADAEFNLRASGRIEVTVASATVLDRKLCESP